MYKGHCHTIANIHRIVFIHLSLVIEKSHDGIHSCSKEKQLIAEVSVQALCKGKYWWISLQRTYHFYGNIDGSNHLYDNNRCSNE